MDHILLCNNCGHKWSGNYAKEDYCPECGSVMINEVDKKFFVYVKWEVSGFVEIKAQTLDKAIDKVKNNFSFYIPDNYKHDFGSMKVDLDMCYKE